jgi:uncharacterized protein YggL (DUF469 family)
MSEELVIKVWDNSDKKPLDKVRKRRLNKKLHLNEFSCLILDIDFSHDKLDFSPVRNIDEIDLLIEGVMVDTGFRLGFSSHSTGAESQCCFEIPHEKFEESASLVMKSIKEYFKNVTDVSLQVYDAYYPPNEVFE